MTKVKSIIIGERIINTEDIIRLDMANGVLQVMAVEGEEEATEENCWNYSVKYITICASARMVKVITEDVE